MEAPKQCAASDLDEMLSEKDWSKTPLGPVETWSSTLRATFDLCQAVSFPMAIIWGADQTLLYNDRYRVHVCGAKHPKSFGENFRECWASAWDVLGPLF